MKLVRLITVCVNEIHGKAWIENICHEFIVQNGLKQGDAVRPLLFNLAL